MDRSVGAAAKLPDSERKDLAILAFAVLSNSYVTC
jgi:hypothetical protein